MLGNKRNKLGFFPLTFKMALPGSCIRYARMFADTFYAL